MDYRSSRFDGYSSYRTPSYDEQRDQQSSKDGPRAKSRPHPSPRRVSRPGVLLYDQRSATTTPAESPRSPQREHRQTTVVRVDNTPQSNQSLDPRRRLTTLNGDVNESALVDTNEITLLGWLEQSVQHAVLKRNLDELQHAAAEARRQEEQQKQRFPEHNALHEQYAARRTRAQQNVDALTSRFDEFKERSKGENASKAIRALVSNVVSDISIKPGQFEAQQQEISSIVRRLDDFQERNTQLEHEVQRLTSENNDLRTQYILNEDDKRRCQELENMYKDLRIKITGELQQKVASCEQSLKECKVWMQDRDSPKSPPESPVNTHNDEDLVLLKSTVDDHHSKLKDHGFKFANMSGLFASQTDHKDLAKKVDSLERTLTDSKLEVSKIDAAQKSVSAQFVAFNSSARDALITTSGKNQDITALKQKLVALENSLDQVKTITPDANEKTATFEKDLENHEVEVAEIRNAQKKLLERMARLQNLNAPNAGPSTSSTTAPQDIKSLQERLDGLTTSVNQQNVARKKELEGYLEGYRHFTVETQNKLKAADDRLSAHDSRVKGLDMKCTIIDNREMNDTQSVLRKVTAIESAITDISSKVSALQSNGASIHTLNEALGRLREAENQLKVEVNAQMESKSTQIKAEVDKIHEIVKRNDHSLESLNTRYNAITTQTLYKSIIGTLEPMAPRIAELGFDIRQVQDDLRALKEPGSSSDVPAELKDQLQKIASIDGLRTDLDKTSDDTNLNTESIQQLSEQVKVWETQLAENTKALMKLEELYNTLRPIENGDMEGRVSTPSSILEAPRQGKQDIGGSPAGHVSTEESKTSLEQIQASITSVAYFLAVSTFNNDFLLIEKVASNVDEKKLRSLMQDFDLGGIFFRGNKHETTGRYALVKMLSPGRIAEAIGKLNNQRWNGRSIKVSAASVKRLEDVILSQTAPTAALASTAMSTPTIHRPTDSSIEPNRENDGDTITVDDASTLNERRYFFKATPSALARAGSSSGTQFRPAAKRRAEDEDEGGDRGQTPHVHKRGRT